MDALSNPRLSRGESSFMRVGMTPGAPQNGGLQTIIKDDQR
jgi:hypothetical protein